MDSEIKLTIDGIPPSVGHYNAYRVAGAPGRQFVQCYPTKAAKDWKARVAAVANGRQVRSDEYTVSYLIYMPTARKQDLDNFAKCILDSLTAAGVIHDDSAVSEIHAYKRLDRSNPHTVIIVRAKQMEIL